MEKGKGMSHIHTMDCDSAMREEGGEEEQQHHTGDSKAGRPGDHPDE